MVAVLHFATNFGLTFLCENINFMVSAGFRVIPIPGRVVFKPTDLNLWNQEHQMGEIVKKEVCKCENCGNEAEMVVTCSLPEVDEKENMMSASEKPQGPPPEKRIMGTATCTHCGNESDMWIDL
jgi:hypothetical protein